MSSSSSDCDFSLLSRATAERRRAAKRIRRFGKPSPFACDFCFSRGKFCVQMPNRKGELVCSQCRKLGRKCVQLSWAAVDRSVEESRRRFDEKEAEWKDAARRFAQLQAELDSRRAVLEQAEARAQQQLWCLEEELEQQGELELLDHVHEASELEGELFGGLPAPSPGGSAVVASSSQGS